MHSKLRLVYKHGLGDHLQSSELRDYRAVKRGALRPHREADQSVASGCIVLCELNFFVSPRMLFSLTSSGSSGLRQEAFRMSECSSSEFGLEDSEIVGFGGLD